jgi:branched-chain amino acid transport system ATP-binding protein
MLKTINLIKKFKGLTATNDLSFNVEKGEIVGIIGPNGAGKTTLFNLITGYLKPTSGKIYFQNKDITGLPPHKIAAAGIIRTFQLDRIYHEFTVLENVVVASHLDARIRLWESVLTTPGYRRKNRLIWDNALKDLQFLGIDDKKDEIAANLSHGHQKLLGIAIALAANPRLLLLDEPLAGMNAEEVNKALDLIRQIRASGISVLMIEHNMKAVMSTCDRLIVINFGTEICRGTCDLVQKDPAVIQAYLGAKKNAA